MYKDRLDMPYVEAVTQEVFRRSIIAHIALPHKVEKDLEIDGKVWKLPTIILKFKVLCHNA